MAEINLLFICSSNSVRSQMAEGWARHLSHDALDIRSAGVSPFPVHPMAVATMKKAGIDISRHRNRRLDNRLMDWADYIITMSEAVRPYSAYFPEKARYDHWSIPNPDNLVSEDVDLEQAYDRVRDTIKRRVTRLLESLDK